MIKNFRSKVAQDIFDGILSQSSKRISIHLHGKIRRLYDQLNAATKVETLRVPPGNNLEKFKGNLKDYWSVRINKQLRIIFKWDNDEASNVDIIDYH
jgi:proteic killer suppression protein